jgi:hypothetical protein
MAPIKIEITCLYCKNKKKVWNHSSCQFCSNVCAANHKYILWLEKWLIDEEEGSSKSKTDGCNKRVRRYFRENGHSCEECALLPMWNNKPLMLEIDHIDGDRKNNKRSNLKLVCPNCHSQTPTFRAKNIKKVP